MTLPVMDLLATLHAATADVRSATLEDDLTEQAALLLVGEVAAQLAARDQVWSAVALTSLDVSQRLYPDAAPLLLDVPPASSDIREATVAAAGLLAALADRYDGASRDRDVTAHRALAFGAAAIQLRHSADLLT